MNKERMFINRFFVTLALRPSIHGADKLVQLSRARRAPARKPMRSTPIFSKGWRTRRVISKS
jgi:hypothetical protein